MKRVKLLVGALFSALIIMHGAGEVYATGTEGLVIPSEYISAESEIKVTTAADEDTKVKSVKYSTDGINFIDITEKCAFHVNGNCNVTFVITYKEKDGTERVAEVKKSITNFDGEKPEISASLKGEILHVKAIDDLSGIKELCINGKSYTKLKDNGIGINVKELESSNAYITVYAQDAAGNKSSTYKIKNPYYVGEKTDGSTDQSKNNPQSTEESKPTQATGTLKQEETNEQESETQQTPQQQTPTQSEPEDESAQEDEVTQEVEQEDEEIEDGEDEAVTVEPVVPESVVSNNDSGSKEGKEFYTIETKNGKIFYLVVDKNQMSDNVYLLTEVGENDLLNFVNYDGNSVDAGEMEIYSIKEEEPAQEVVPEEVTEEEEEPEQKVPAKKSPFGIMAAVLLVGMGAYYFKKKKNGYPDDEIGDLDEYETEDEEM